MKRLLTLSLLYLLLVACTDNELVEQQELSLTQKITSFIEQAQRENMSQKEMDKAINTFILQMGGTLIPESQWAERAMTSAKADGCQQGKWTNYQLNDTDSVGVLSFTGCTSVCPKTGGDGYQISEWTWTGSKWDVKYTTVCTRITSSAS